MSRWERIESLGQTCPVCHKTKWCLKMDAAVICGRVPTCQLATCSYCRAGQPKRAGNAGWMHVTGRRTFRYDRSRSTHFRIPDYRYFAEQHAAFRADIQPGQFAWWARQLGVTPQALDRLEMGWSGHYPIGASFPLRTPRGDICGISIRSIHGRKTCMRGSALGAGLFIPTDLPSDSELFVAEGASDTAALLSISLSALGRPSISTSPDVVRRFVTGRGFPHVVVVGDNDPHGAGQTAAQALARYLQHFVPCRLLIPPAKDVREWILTDADRDQVMEGVHDVN